MKHRKNPRLGNAVMHRHGVSSSPKHDISPTALILAFLGICGTAQEASAHARFKLDSITPPRNTSTGLKTAPCGGITRTATPRQFAPGQTIDVEWEETIDHPGYFIISFSPAGDQNFASNVLVPKIVDDKNSGTPLPHFYKTSVTLPSISCTDCTLQLIQVMEENPANPSFYYSCSDIQLVAPSTTPAPVTGAAALGMDQSISLSWTNPIGDFGQTIIVRGTSALSVTLVDSAIYKVGDSVGNGSVVYAGTSTQFLDAGLINGTTYHYGLFAQNTTGMFSAGSFVSVAPAAAAANQPPVVSLTVSQGGTPTQGAVFRDAGGVVITATVFDPNSADTHTYDWSATDVRLVDKDTSPLKFAFDPAQVDIGNYEIKVSVMDSGQPVATATQSLSLDVADPPSNPGNAGTTTTSGTKSGGGGPLGVGALASLLGIWVRHRRTVAKYQNKNR